LKPNSPDCDAEPALRPALEVGVALITLGVLALPYQGITYATREKVIDVGPFKVSVDEELRIPVPPTRLAFLRGGTA
jgi:hypothetical protein